MANTPSRRDFLQQTSLSMLGSRLLLQSHTYPVLSMMISSTTDAAAADRLALAPTFTLRSTELGGQFTSTQFFNGMGYTGDNQSPQLYWENAPAGTQSFAVTMYDLDAPTGSGFWHWVVFNIPATVRELKANAGDLKKGLSPAGAVQSNTDMGLPGYVGIAPTPGPAHRYLITVHALSQTLELDGSATPAYVGFSMAGITLDRASLLVYGKQKA